MSTSGANSPRERRTCWVCFATDDDDGDVEWVRPCGCKGTTKWVHQNCLQRWIDEKQKGNSTLKVPCPQCNTEYIIVFPKLGPLLKLMEICDRIINRVCPFVAGGIFLGSMYWTAVTYGAVTVMQVLGSKEGHNVMEGADPVVLLIGLPTIPVMLILGKMVRWQDYVLRLLRKHFTKLPLLNYLFQYDLATSRIPAEHVPISDPISATRLLCGALILPTIATMAGKVMFGNVQSNFQRTLLGGIVFIAIKGVLKIYYKQKQYMNQANRVVLDYPAHVEQETPKQSPSGTSTQQ